MEYAIPDDTVLAPGVIDTSARDAPGWGSVGGMTINGQSSFNFSYDGIVSKDTGSNSGNYAAPGLDSIAEVKVQSSNFQAEYGRSSGASITAGPPVCVSWVVVMVSMLDSRLRAVLSSNKFIASGSARCGATLAGRGVADGWRGL